MKSTNEHEEHCHSHGCSCCDSGHDHEEHHEEMSWWKPALSLAMLLAGIVMDAMEVQWFQHGWLRLAWYAAAWLPTGLGVLREAIEEAREGEIFSEFLLMTVASLGARYIFTPHIEAGLAASYEYYSSYESVCEGTDREMYCKAGDFLDHHLVHVAVEGKFNWFTLFDLLRPYSRVGVGALLEFDSGLERVGLPSVQLTPVGLEFLFPYISVYAELGAGYRGFMSGGIALRI